MNSLSRAASPYLRQHQNNPVDWVEWNDEAFARARKENKLVLVSIGYAACHWCHVMAHESFEDEEIAEVMNRNFICIKVDREERPDVDQVYLEAVHLMTGRGGWPLNCFMLPDGKPVFGGTYFRPHQWKDILERLAEVWRREPEAVAKQAGEITAHMVNIESRVAGATANKKFSWRHVYQAFATRFDGRSGGTLGAPKFPMPYEWQFLLRYGWYAKDEACLGQVRLTLDRMAAGGIHDQLGGGFARYSTDEDWKVPHFEKMLYDNAQLLELYAEAGIALNEPRYREAALGIAEFLERELAAPGGGYCSAMDADSEGEEGKYYIWTKAELQNILGERFGWFAELCGVDGDGLWEEGRNILLRRHSLEELAARRGWTLTETVQSWETARRDLLAVREQRPKPVLDDKVLTSWNGLLLKAFSSAYRHTGEQSLRQRAIRLADFLLRKAVKPGGGLWHRGGSVSLVEPWRGEFAIEGFLEDYAFLAEGLVELYQVTFVEQYLHAARGLADHALEHFGDPGSPFLFFTAKDSPPVLVRKQETIDNVIPSSNAAFARVLFLLADYFAEPRYRDRAESMLAEIRAGFPAHAAAYASWALTLLMEDLPPATLAVVGPESGAFLEETVKRYMPHLRLAGSGGPSELPLMHGKHLHGATGAFRCERGTCGLPARDWKKLLELEKVAWNPDFENETQG